MVKSIHDIMGNEISPQTFEYPGVDESVLQLVFQDLLAEGLIKPVRTRKSIDTRKLKAICDEFLIDADELKRFVEKNRCYDNLA